MITRSIQVKQAGSQFVKVIMDGEELQGVRHVQFSASVDEVPTMTLEFYALGAEVEVEGEEK